MDLVFPHHENEIAQAESATGKPFAKYWMHNGLTRFNTKKVAKSDADPEMQAALIRMTLHNLLAEYPGELMRFFVLSTHYRRPIEYSEEEIESKRKGLDTFYRLFERVERICGTSPYDNVPDILEPRALARADIPGARAEPRALARAEIQSENLAAACDEHFAAFKQAMDDDFNTAGAIAALFAFAASVNRFIEQEKLESTGPDTGKQDTLAATRCLIGVARLIGLFLDPPEKKKPAGDDLTDKVMQVLIEVRQHLRKKKDFETADIIRDRLKEQSITLEDRPDGTIWRAE